MGRTRQPIIIDNRNTLAKEDLVDETGKGSDHALEGDLVKKVISLKINLPKLKGVAVLIK